MIAVDRYGHGYSDFGNTETSVKRQAAMIFPILQRLRRESYKPIILVGYSYGGTVASRLAMDYPQLIDNLVLSAPAIDPNNEKRFWFNKPLNCWAIKWAMPQNFIIANDEKKAHANECLKMQPDWYCPMLPFHKKKMQPL